jgi:hypothetical protein
MRDRRRGVYVYRGHGPGKCSRCGLALAVAALLGLLAGCGSSDGTGSTQSSAPPPPVPSSSSTTNASPTTTSRPPSRTSHAQSSGKLPGSPAAFVKTALTTSEPRLACQAFTAAALQKAYGGESACEAAIRAGGAASSLSHIGVYFAPGQAKVSAVPQGGPSDGETVKITLIQQGGSWRIASLHSDVPVGP